jgi:two-component system, cell cycle sensor histidine kinase and response regulator CckA
MTVTLMTSRAAATADVEPGRSFEKLLSDTITEVVWSGVAGGHGLGADGNVERICGCGREELLHSPSTVWVDRAHPADQSRVENAWGALVMSGTLFDAEYRLHRPDGTYVWVHGRAVLREGTDEPVVDAVFADVSERRALVDQIRHLQKVEVVVTGGIAHDFNNVLAIILANNTLLLDALDTDDPRRADAAAAVEAAERAAMLTRQLLPFTRKHSFEPSIVDLNAVVTGAEKLLRRVIGEDIKLTLRLDDNAGTTRADAHLLEQVLLNLAINARDAMPGGGNLEIETSDAAPSHVRLAVSDTGCGMDAATRQRIFEPFFTTKAQGKGTGLGLATSFGIVHEAGGTIAVESEPGRGTVFEILLPLAGEAARLPDTSLPTGSSIERGTEHVLIVEDDESVRLLVRRLLVHCGYRVVCARDAQEALAVLLSSPEPIDLVVSDLILPQLNGAEIVKSIQARSPRTRALFMSGHAANALIQKSLLREDQAFIHKPFTPRALARRVREVLDA